MEIKPKNFWTDDNETYFLKMAVEGPTIPARCKLAANWFLMKHNNDLFDSQSRKEYNATMCEVWHAVLNDDREFVIQKLLEWQHAREIVDESVRQEFKNPVSRMRIIIWLVAIAAVVILPFVLLGPK